MTTTVTAPMAVRFRDGREAAEGDFRSRDPRSDRGGTLARLRRLEYGRLDATGHVYLDYTGGSLYAQSQVEAHAELLRSSVFGNPHSGSPTSLAATGYLERARRAVCRFFNA